MRLSSQTATSGRILWALRESSETPRFRRIATRVSYLMELLWTTKRCFTSVTGVPTMTDLLLLESRRAKAHYTLVQVKCLSTSGGKLWGPRPRQKERYWFRRPAGDKSGVGGRADKGNVIYAQDKKRVVKKRLHNISFPQPRRRWLSPLEWSGIGWHSARDVKCVNMHATATSLSPDDRGAGGGLHDTTTHYCPIGPLLPFCRKCFEDVALSSSVANAIIIIFVISTTVALHARTYVWVTSVFGLLPFYPFYCLLCLLLLEVGSSSRGYFRVDW